MMKRYSRLLIFIPVLFLLAFTFVTQSGKIFWSSSRKLTWADFKGAPDMTVKEHASTGWHLDARFTARNDTMRMIVKCWFSENESWLKKGNETDYLLAHEQAHFDLAEVYTRKLRKAYSEKKFTVADLKTSFKATHKEMMDACRKRQEQYDSETNHSLIHDKQAEWQKLIAKELDDLKAYSDTLVWGKISN